MSASFVVGTLVAGNLVFAAPADSQNELLSAILQEVQALTGLVGNQGTTTNIELTPLGSSDGAINPQGTRQILFYGDVLCEIEAGGSMYFKFGGDTLVKHLDDCTTRNGSPINLNPPTDTMFHEGDILVLERITTNFEVVFQELS